MPFNAGDISRVTRHMDGLAREFDGRAMREDLAKLGKVVAKEVDVAVRSTPAASGSLADGSMSGWRRGKPIVIGGQSSPHSRDVGVTISPGRAAGPMKVLEDGRTGRAKGDVVEFTRRAKGQDRQRRRRVKRANGSTEGKGTWTRAVKSMESTVRKSMPVLVARKVKRVTGGG